MKTDKQIVLELQRGMPIENVIHEVLMKYRGQSALVQRAALDIGVSDGTLYSWCEALGLEIDRYRCPEPVHLEKADRMTETHYVP